MLPSSDMPYPDYLARLARADNPTCLINNLTSMNYCNLVAIKAMSHQKQYGLCVNAAYYDCIIVSTKIYQRPFNENYGAFRAAHYAYQPYSINLDHVV